MQGRVLEFRCANLDAAAGEWKRDLAHRCLGGSEERRSDLRGTAANHDHIWVEQVHEASEPNAKHLSRSLEDRCRLDVAFGRGLSDGFCAEIAPLPLSKAREDRCVARAQRLKSLTSECGSRGNSFKTPEVATAAARPARLNDDVTKFTRCTVKTAIQFPIEDDSAADSCADSHEDQSPRTSSSPLKILTQCRGIGVIFDQDWYPQVAREDRSQRHVSPSREIRRVREVSARCVNRAGRRHSDTANLGEANCGAGGRGAERRAQRPDDGSLAGHGVRRPQILAANASVSCDDCAVDLRPAEVDDTGGLVTGCQPRL